MATVDNLLEEFDADEAICFDSGRLNNITDITLSIASVLGSLVATVLVAAGAYKALSASAAAVPAACTTLQRIVDFRGRSLWYFNLAANIKALSVSLRYAKEPDLEKFAKERAQLEIDADNRWKQIGGSAEAPKTRPKSKKLNRAKPRMS
ncbi:MAG TPA: hypothetical protein VN924_20055 [Bryobacteraceae bacterium]|nr:hypothetical protein [Bryobacteraceae bacterium]